MPMWTTQNVRLYQEVDTPPVWAKDITRNTPSITIVPCVITPIASKED